MTKNNLAKKGYLTLGEVARMINVSASTINYWARYQRYDFPPPKKVQRKNWWKKSDILHWLGRLWVLRSLIRPRRWVVTMPFDR